MNTYNTEIADVRARNPVNGGLLGAANELESAQEAKIKADQRYRAAVAAFKSRYYAADSQGSAENGGEGRL